MAEKLTPEEIKKALECCEGESPNCSECPANRYEAGKCFDIVKVQAVEIMNSQQAELEEARIGVKSYKGKYESAVETAKDLKTVIAEKQAEIERLQEEIGSLNKKYPCIVQLGEHCLMYARSLDDYDKQIGDISSEAIKEFTERLKDYLRKQPKWSCRREKYDNVGFTYDDVFFGIDKVVKEMVGDDK